MPAKTNERNHPASRKRRNGVIGFLLLVCVFLCSAAHAADESCARAETQRDLSWRGVPGDMWYVLKTPFRMTRTEGAAVLALAGITAGLVAGWDGDIDDSIRRRSGDFPYATVRRLGELGHEYGRSDMRVVVLFGGLSGAMLAGGAAFGDTKLVRTAALMAESFAFTMLVTGTIKLAAGRDRPYLDNGAGSFEFMRFGTEKAEQSMPSGHASAAFSMMTVIAKQYPSWWVRIPAYTLAAGASLDRINSRQHWTSDVFIGAVLGYFISSAVVDRHSGANRPLRLSVAPGRAALLFHF